MDYSSFEYVNKHAQNVFIDNQNLIKFSEELESVNNIEIVPVFSGTNFSNNSDRLNWLFLFACVNFCFWNDIDWEVELEGRKYKRTEAMIKLLEVVYKIRQVTPNDLVNLNQEQFKEIFGLTTNLQMINERLENIRKGFSILISSFGGKFENVVQKSRGNILNLVDIISENFSSFKDISIYKNKELPFLKRAKTLAYQVSLVEEYSDYFHDIEQLTSFADYRIPQILRHQGVLRYSEDLSHKVDNYIVIEHDSELEIEIRSQSLYAIYMIFLQINKKFNQPEIDNYLWTKSRNISDMKPHHRTRSIYY